MGPAVSRPDDERKGTVMLALLRRLQWGRPFHGRMTPGPEPEPEAFRSASMGPAVSRPDDLTRPTASFTLRSSFNGAGRFTAG